MIININLLPWREKELNFKNQLFGAICGVLVLISLTISYGIKQAIGVMIQRQDANNSYIKRETVKIEREIKQFIDIDQEQKKLLEKIGTLDKLQANRTFIVLFMNTLARITPADMILKRMERSDNTLSLEGFSTDNAAITTFIKRIENTKWMYDPKLAEINKAFKDKINVQQVSIDTLSKFSLALSISEKDALESIGKKTQ